MHTSEYGNTCNKFDKFNIYTETEVGETNVWCITLHLTLLPQAYPKQLALNLSLGPPHRHTPESAHTFLTFFLVYHQMRYKVIIINNVLSDNFHTDMGARRCYLIALVPLYVIIFMGQVFQLTTPHMSTYQTDQALSQCFVSSSRSGTEIWAMIFNSPTSVHLAVNR